MNNPAHLPVVDISGFHADARRREFIATAVNRALSERGFMYVTGHGIDSALIGRAFDSSRHFFERPRALKESVAYTDATANFGFQGLEAERLDPKSAPDLKEAFTMRNARALVAQAHLWPDESFRDTALALYEASLSAAHRLLNVLGASLALPADYFTPLHGGENVTLRFLHYPANLQAKSESQLGAGAHTDYGSITLLFQDDVGGLEVRDADGEWRFAPPVPDAVVINTGDLMERWTNGRFRSTLHRVRPITGDRDRHSIALFVDPDSAVAVECIPSCVGANRPPRYPAITAGEHLRQKISASHH
jgi:isopenicillin N synthase-like dioxygenase